MSSPSPWVNLDRAKRAIELFHAGKVELMRPMLAEDALARVGYEWRQTPTG